jgi:hypothetical protein
MVVLRSLTTTEKQIGYIWERDQFMSDTVIVRVWDSRANFLRDDTNLNDHGHASIEIPSFGTYLSFWPASRGGKLDNLGKVFLLRDAKEVRSYEDDCYYMRENRRMGDGKADHAITLTSLNAQAVYNEWKNRWIDVRQALAATLARNPLMVRPDMSFSSTKYNVLGSNCSTYVGRALVKGCVTSNPIKAIATLLIVAKGELAYWEPGDVLRLANLLKALE